MDAHAGDFAQQIFLNVILSGVDVSGGSAYTPPESFYLTRRMTVGAISATEVHAPYVFAEEVGTERYCSELTQALPK